MGSNSAVTQSYGFDALNRLEAVVDSGVGTQSYAYDRWGNRAMVTGSYQAPGYPVQPAMVANASEVAAKFPNNRIVGLSYDSAGNLLGVEASRTARYDGEGRVDRVTAV